MLQRLLFNVLEHPLNNSEFQWEWAGLSLQSVIMHISYFTANFNTRMLWFNTKYYTQQFPHFYCHFTVQQTVFPLIFSILFFVALHQNRQRKCPPGKSNVIVWCIAYAKVASAIIPTVRLCELFFSHIFSSTKMVSCAQSIDCLIDKYTIDWLIDWLIVW